jgi:hypothetical protein
LERIVSGGAGVIYKGEGWYVTDYSKKSSGGKEQVAKSEKKTLDSSKNDTAKNDTTKTETPSTESQAASSSQPKSSPESKTSNV